METLKRRADFLRLAKGRKCAMPGLVLQAARTPRPTSAEISTGNGPRVGFTVTKRVSARAVDRNRIKRRLRAAARQVLPALGRADFDYVLIGRPRTLTIPFAGLVADLEQAVRKVHASRPRKDGAQDRAATAGKRKAVAP